MDITNKIKTVEDAYRSLGMEREKSLPVITNVPEEDLEHIIATHDLEIVTRALNEDWKADFSNPDQYKYFNWFYVDDSGAFRFSSTYFTYSYTLIGSRLCYKTEEIARTIATRFESDWDTYLKGQ